MLAGVAGDDADVVQDGGLEAGQRDRDRIGADRNAGDREHAGLVRDDFEGLRPSRCSWRRRWRQESRRRPRRRRVPESDCAPWAKARELRHADHCDCQRAVVEHCFSCILPLHELQAYKRR